MIITGLDGKSYKWILKNQKKENCSSYHTSCRSLLKELFPLDTILEEVVLPGSFGLTVDFFVPIRRLGVEVQGEQHFKFIKHYHTDQFGFAAAIQRDKNKVRWFTLNSLNFVALNYSWSENESRSAILAAVTKRTA